MAEEVLGTAAVIGGGIFGVTAALELAAAGVAVTLYESRGGILAGATARNFFRLHRGYHYPRDPGTAAQSRAGYESFTAMFRAALTPPVPHFYAIAAEGSLTTPEQFAAHCDTLRLRATPVPGSFLVPGSVAACFEVDEAYYDVGVLRDLCRARLARSRVRVETGCVLSAHVIGRSHDVVVVAAYAALNEVLQALGCPVTELQYETCEVAVIRAPRLPACSVVVMDGPFVSVAPAANGLHILYDVVNSVHTRSTGHAEPWPLPSRSNAPAMLASARRFLPLDYARRDYSLHATRVVPPHADATDARPTEVAWVGPRVLSVLSGKVCTSVDAARVAARMVTEKLRGCDEPADLSDNADVAAPVAAP